jgi:hypothetical protein
MTITLTREEAQSVLDALVKLHNVNTAVLCNVLNEIETLRARLAQPEPEPVAWWNGAAKFASPEEKNWDKRTGGILSVGCDTPLYTTPQQREWQGLTDEEIRKALAEAGIDAWFSYRHAAYVIEDKLKAKNDR